MNNRLPPANIEAEESVLGCILIDPDALHRIRSILKGSHFFQREKHGWVYDVFLHLSDKAEPIDFLTVCGELERRQQLNPVGGAAFVTTLINAVPTSIHAEHYASLVEREYVRRQAIALAGAIAQKAYETEDVHDLIAYISGGALGIELYREGDGPLSATQIVSDFYDDLERWAKDPLPPGAVRGISTGIEEWDNMMGGMDRGESLVVLAARSRTGKTALALASAYAMSQNGYKVLYFALEMKRRTLIARLACADSQVSYKKIKRGVKENSSWYASQGEFDKFMAAAMKIADARNFYIDDTHDLAVSDIRARAMQLAQRLGGLDLVVVDTGNLVQDASQSGMNFAQRESTKIRGLRNLIKELDCVGYVTWQLNRLVESRPVANLGRAPTLLDLRDTGGVEEHASDVVGLYRDELYNEDSKYKNVMHLFALKRRNDEDRTSLLLGYNAAYQRFFPVDVKSSELL